MKQLLLVSVMVSTGMAGTAAAGRAKAAWCNHDLSSSSVQMQSLKGTDARQDLDVIATAQCNPGDVADKDWPAIDAAYRNYSTRLGLDAAAWADVADWLASDDPYHWPNLKIEGKQTSKLDPMEQLVGIETNTAGGKTQVDPEYFLDSLGPKVSETARAYYISKCIKNSNPTAWAVCQGDIDVLDGKKLFAEMNAATTHKGRDRMYVRLVLDEVKRALPAHAAKVKELTADPAWAEYFKLAKQQRADWDARWKAGGDLLALADEMDAALVDPSGHAGSCVARSWAAVKAAAAKIPAKSFTLFRPEKEELMMFVNDARATIPGVLMNTPEGYLAGNAYAICWSIQPHDSDNRRPKDGLAEAIEDMGWQWRGFRGPRNGVEQEIFNSEAMPKAGAPSLLMLFRPWFEQRSHHDSNGASGIVTAVKVKGSKVTFEFQKKKHQEYVSLNCRNTNHVQAIRDNGEVVYDQICADSKLITTMDGPDPYSVSAENAKGVKPGMYIFATGDFLFFAWKDAKLGVPAIVLGQPAK